jgi:hypothetical protein
LLKLPVLVWPSLYQWPFFPNQLTLLLWRCVIDSTETLATHTTSIQHHRRKVGTTLYVLFSIKLSSKSCVLILLMLDAIWYHL